MRFDVVVCGSLHLDIVVRAERLPAMDETAVGSAWRYVCGGKGHNQAVQAARAGARVAMIGRVGRDDFGDRLLASLDVAGVDRAGVSVDPEAGSGMSVAIVDANGDYGAVIVSGANLAVDPGAVVADAPVLVLQNEVPEAANLAAARSARARGGCVVLNAAPARPVGTDLLDLVEVLVVNRVEAAQMSGYPVGDAGEAGVAAARLAGPGRSVVVTLGAAGLILREAGGATETVAAERVSVVTTHGAGDCFIGVLAARLAAGEALRAACRSANAAAARHVAGESAAAARAPTAAD